MKVFAVLVVLVLALGAVHGYKVLHASPKLSNIAYVLEECATNLTQVQRAIVHSTQWTVERLNNILHEEFGVFVYQVCDETDYLNVIFELYQKKTGGNATSQILGTIFDPKMDVPIVAGDMARMLHLNPMLRKIDYLEKIKASVKMVEHLGWTDDLQVYGDANILEEFNRWARRSWICVNQSENLGMIKTDGNSSSSAIILLGLAWQLKDIELNTDPARILYVDLDSNLKHHQFKFENLLRLEPHLDDIESSQDLNKILPSPILLEIASSIIQLIPNNCQNTSCSQDLINSTLSFNDVLKHLKLESVSSEFLYNLQDANGTILLTYSLFEDNITIYDAALELIKKPNMTRCEIDFDQCLEQCVNFQKAFIDDESDSPSIYYFYPILNMFNLRPAPWVYAFLSLSFLGIIFCLSVMMFILTRLCRKQVLEGNPLLTIVLLVDVILMFACVLPFAIEGVDKTTVHHIYLARALSVTIPYTLAFALLLSRTILLATISKEVGFLSHVAGGVQSFLALFIFAVQCALSLQLTNTCGDVFRNGWSLFSLMSYNAVLLILLTFITPMIAKSKRNYREGKYFTIAIVLLACAWSCWMPAYAVLGAEWKDPLLCFGLVATGSILLGCIFIPKTYMITVSQARERFTSALPSLATATSAMDLYRASTQPVYDCVNVAAIAAANLRAEHEGRHHHQADFYSAPPEHNMEEEEEDDVEFVVQSCDSPAADKITRF